MSRIDDLKKQHPQLNVSLIDIIASIDPTTSYKYTPFMVKLLKNELETDDVKREIAEILFDKECISYIKRFEIHCVAQRIVKNDITRYSGIDEVISAVKEGDEVVKQKEAERQIIKLYDKDGYLIVIPLTFEASKSYGANTKWCITQQSYWKDYQWKYRIIYVIDKNTNTKWAVSRKYDDDSHVKGWTQQDKEISPLMFNLPEEIIMFIMKELKKPQFETELKVLKNNSIFLDNGSIVNIEDADQNILTTFVSKFGKYISPELRETLESKKVSFKSINAPTMKKKLGVSDYFGGSYEHEIEETVTRSLDIERVTEIMRRLNGGR